MPGAPGRFSLKPWVREAEGGGGVMGFLRGRFFEKCGLHISEVHGTFTPEMAATMPGADEDPRFIATGDQPDRSHAQPARAGRAHEHPLSWPPLTAGSAAGRT